ncbi:MAG TPA: RDD family protein [Verrucomicrobiae bacterium]|nr:RDD family protein [Verrucomicrobiae bacterium]
METSNLTVMFTDMKGFTIRTSSQSREETRQMIERHREILLPVITRLGGRLIKEIGDAFLVVFDSPTDAVLAGVALQETLAKHNAGAPKDRIEVRIAVNSGEVIMEKGDVYGEAVNIAARVQAHAEANEIYFTEAVYLSMNKPEVHFEELGYRILKGLPHKIKLYKVLRPGPSGQDAEGRGTDLPSAIVPTWRRACAFVMDGLLISLAVFLAFAAPFSHHARKTRELHVWADTWAAQAETHRAAPAKTEALKKEIDALTGELAAAQGRIAAKRRELEAVQIDLDEKGKLLDRDDELFSQKSESTPSPETNEALIREETELRKRRQAFEQAQEELSAKVSAVDTEEEKLSERQTAIDAKNDQLSQLTEQAEEQPEAANPESAEVMLWGSGPIPEGFPGAGEIEEFRGRRGGLEREAGLLSAGFAGSWALLFLIYHTVFFSHKGRTPGKAFFKLKVSRDDGRALGAARSLFRSLAYFLSALPLGFGFFAVKFDVKHRAWHDKLTGTKVIFD